MQTIIRSLFIFAILATGTAHAGARQQMMAFTRNLQGLSSPFVQTVYNSAGKVSDKSTGVVKLKAPRQFRWQTLKPYPQTIVADGNHIWIYDPDMEQVTVRSQSAEESNSPLAVLIDSSEMERQFKLTEAATSNGLEWLLLTPKRPDDAPFEKAMLGFSPLGLVRMELYDGLGQRTVISFTQWQRNPKFSRTDFAFTPPKGADVIGDVKPGATVTPIQN
jgi:outer membrane lipoprotein carrier protein